VTTKLPKGKASEKHSTKVTRPSNSEAARPAKKLQLSLPGHSGDAASSPNSSNSHISSSSQKRKSFSASPRSNSPASGRRGSVNWIDVCPMVRLRDIKEVTGVETCYKIGKVHSGFLFQAEHLDTKKKCWMQPYKLKQGKSNKAVRQRLLAMRSLDHPHVLKVLDLFETESHVYAVFEATEGGSAEEVSDMRGVSEPMAAAIIRQVFAALGHCHSKGLVLRSLSLRNILFLAPPTEDSVSVKLLVPCGDAIDNSSLYTAPELKNKTYIGSVNDLWSCGMILSSLLTGEFVLIKRPASTVSEEFKQAHAKWNSVSEQAKALTRALVCRDYAKRPTVEACRLHPWLAAPPLTPSLTPCVRKALRHMAKRSPPTPLKKAFLQLMLNLVVPQEELREVRKAFKVLDTDGDGTVSEAELQVPLYRLFPGEQAQAALTAITSTAVFSAHRTLAYSEFLLWACDKQIFSSATHLLTTYQLLDSNKDGAVTSEELKEVLTVDLPSSQDSYAWQALLSCISSSANCFHYPDFCHFMKK